MRHSLTVLMLSLCMWGYGQAGNDVIGSEYAKDGLPIDYTRYHIWNCEGYPIYFVNWSDTITNPLPISVGGVFAGKNVQYDTGLVSRWHQSVKATYDTISCVMLVSDTSIQEVIYFNTTLINLQIQIIMTIQSGG